MSAELTSNALLDLLGRALSPITSALEVVRTRRTPTLWHDVRAERKTFTPKTIKSAAAWTYDNPLKETIAIRRFGVIFNDEPTATWKPIVEVWIDQGLVFQSAGDAFAAGNLDVDLGGGRPLPRDKSLTVFIWNGGTDATPKDATFSVQAGEP